MRGEAAVQTPTLYDRLGGVYNIATVVDDLIDRIMVDPRLNANPLVDEAHHRVTPAGFKYLVTEMVCWATGGPQQYSGRSMGDSHRHLMITDGDPFDVRTQIRNLFINGKEITLSNKQIRLYEKYMSRQ